MKADRPPRFADRVAASGEANALSRALADRRAAGHDVLDLTVSNPTIAGFDYPTAPILAALSDPAIWRYEPAPAGLPAARAAVADYYRARGVAVAPEQIFLTCSTSEAYGYLFRLLLDPGETVLAPQPSYPLFAYLAQMQDAALAPYALAHREGVWRVDFASLEEAAELGLPRAVLYVNPNNPTGSFLKRDEWPRLRDFCRVHGLPLIVDEVFGDYVLATNAAPLRRTLADETELPVFVLSGLSKISALPQMKLGWIVLAGPPAYRRAALTRLELIGDTFLSVSTPVQVAAAAMLEARHTVQPQILARCRRNLAHLATQLHGTPARVLPVEGGWYAVVQLPATRSDEEWALAAIREAGVSVHPGYLFDFVSEAHLVVSLLTLPAVFDPALHRLATLFRAG